MRSTGREHDGGTWGIEDGAAVGAWLFARAASERMDAPPVSPSRLDEIRFLTGLDADGTVSSSESYWSDGTVTAFKYGAATAGTGATVRVYLDPSSAFTTTEQATIAKGLATWEAIANVQFTTVASGGYDLLFTRGSDGRAFTHQETTSGSGATLGHYSATPYISIDTSVFGFDLSGSFTADAGYGLDTVIHEIGHALGLGHGGNYNGSVTPHDQQYSAWDDRLWTLMSYISWIYGDIPKYHDSYTVTGTVWPSAGGSTHTSPQTPMMLDILAIQRLYGVSTHSPFTGGQVYGFNCNVAGVLHDFYDFTVNAAPAITIYNQGTNNTLDCSGYSVAQTISLVSGTFSSVGGGRNNVGIADTTAVTKAIGGSGNDVISGSFRADTLDGGAGDDRLWGGSNGPDALIGGAGNDTVDFSAAANGVTATFVTSPRTGAGSYSYTGTFGTTVSGTLSGIENYLGSAYADSLTGDDGANVFRGGGGVDTLIGRGGADTYYIDSSRAAIVEAEDGGFDQVFASVSYTLSANIETLALTGGAVTGTGNDSDNTITGNDLGNTLSGMGGNDMITAGRGDNVDGGAGDHDRVTFDFLEGLVITLSDSGDGSIDTSDGGSFIRGIEDVYANARNDVIIGNSAANVLSGDYGNDVLVSGGGFDTLIGGEGNDLADFGTATANLLISLATAGPYTITANGVAFAVISGIEDVTAGSGNDTLIGSDANNILRGGAGDDVITGGMGFETTVKQEQLYGEAGDDALVAGKGNAVLDGGDGDDVLYLSASVGSAANGGSGTDRVDFSNVASGSQLKIDLSMTDQFGASKYQINNPALAASGTLTAIEDVDATRGNDTITGDGAKNTFYGNDGDDVLTGNGGGDRLTGGFGFDHLSGGKGGDRLEGDAGQDMLTGGRGGDKFVFTAADFGSSIGAADEIVDFARKQGDLIDLQLIDASDSKNHDQAFTFIGDADFTGKAGELRYEVHSGAAYVFGDTDGDGLYDFVLQVDDTPVLKATDFVL